jgi:hypothetical protein
VAAVGGVNEGGVQKFGNAGDDHRNHLSICCYCNMLQFSQHRLKGRL